VWCCPDAATDALSLPSFVHVCHLHVPISIFVATNFKASLGIIVIIIVIITIIASIVVIEIIAILDISIATIIIIIIIIIITIPITIIIITIPFIIILIIADAAIYHQPNHHHLHQPCSLGNTIIILTTIISINSIITIISINGIITTTIDYPHPPSPGEPRQVHGLLHPRRARCWEGDTV
jgi:hypothetical protein